MAQELGQQENAHPGRGRKPIARVVLRTLAGDRIGLPGIGQCYDHILTVPADFPVCDLLQCSLWVKETSPEEPGKLWESAQGQVKVKELGWQPKAFALAGGMVVDKRVNLPIGYGSAEDNNTVYAINSEPGQDALDLVGRQGWRDCLNSCGDDCVECIPGITTTDEDLVSRIAGACNIAIPFGNHQDAILWVLRPTAPYVMRQDAKCWPTHKGNYNLFTDIARRSKTAYAKVQLTGTAKELQEVEKEAKQGVLDAASYLPLPGANLNIALSKRIWLNNIGEFLPKEAITILCGMQRAAARPYVWSWIASKQHWQEFNQLLLTTCDAIRSQHIRPLAASAHSPKVLRPTISIR